MRNGGSLARRFSLKLRDQCYTGDSKCELRKWGSVALKFYFDTHIARVVAEQRRARGVDVVRCEEVGMAQASDKEHLEYATEQGRIMVSQDEDYARLDAYWRQAGRTHAGIMKVSPDYQAEAQISHMVQQLLFYVAAEQAGAVD
jgi:predicted nuclease of predicted toxin-antitoxin system